MNRGSDLRSKKKENHQNWISDTSSWVSSTCEQYKWAKTTTQNGKILRAFLENFTIKTIAFSFLFVGFFEFFLHDNTHWYIVVLGRRKNQTLSWASFGKLHFLVVFEILIFGKKTSSKVKNLNFCFQDFSACSPMTLHHDILLYVWKE